MSCVISGHQLAGVTEGRLPTPHSMPPVRGSSSQLYGPHVQPLTLRQAAAFNLRDSGGQHVVCGRWAPDWRGDSGARMPMPPAYSAGPQRGFEQSQTAHPQPNRLHRPRSSRKSFPGDSPRQFTTSSRPQSEPTCAKLILSDRPLRGSGAALRIHLCMLLLGRCNCMLPDPCCCCTCLEISYDSGNSSISSRRGPRRPRAPSPAGGADPGGYLDPYR